MLAMKSVTKFVVISALIRPNSEDFAHATLCPQVVCNVVEDEW